MVRFVALAALCAAVLVLPAEGGNGLAKVKNTNGWIESIAMDGSRVAYAVHGQTCTKVFVWNVQTGGGARVSGKRTCEADSTSTGAGVREIAVAGTRVAWIVNLGGNTESADYLYAAKVPRPKEKLLARGVRMGDVGGVLAGGWIGGLVGDQSMIALNIWQTDASGAVTGASLRRVDPARLKAVSTGAQVLRAAAADAGRIAVARKDGTVALYSSAGELLRAIVPTSVKEIALEGGDLVVLTSSSTIEVYSTATGQRRATWTVKAGAARLDVAFGRGVYAVDRAVHVVRLADGRDVELPPAPRAVEGLEVEAAGVVYAYNTVAGTKGVGNLAFVPMPKVTSLLGP
jgi:hypothetical protein